MVIAVEEILAAKIPLKHARAQLGWSQTKLGEMAGVHRLTIKNCEKGDSIRLETAYKILNALNSERHRQFKQALRLDDLTWNIRP